MKIKAYSTSILLVYSLILVSIGFYFILIRSTFLPEDARFTGASLKEIVAVAPNFAQWINKVFIVLGGYMISTGILTLYVNITSFRAGVAGSLATLAFTGITSIGLMTVVNLLINSDFKWPLVALAGLWGLSIFLHIQDQ